MKKAVTLLVLALTMLSMTSVFAASDVWVDGYYRQDGKYVEGHHRSSPDNDKTNNYNYPGNTNPYK